MNASNEGNDNNNNDQQRKKGKGRQKIQMAKIENETNLQVTFSKRRAGVFKKASELSTLCGAESVVLVFSPGDKPHTFGHPDFDTVTNRFLAANKVIADETPQPTTAADHLIAAHSEAAMHQRVQELVSTESDLNHEKRRKIDLDQSNKVNPQLPQLEELDKLQLDQMKQVVTSFHMVYEDVKKVEAENAMFNVNHDVATNSSWNNNIDHNVVASSLWNNVNHDIGGTSSWNNVNHDIGGTSSWNNVNDLPGNSSWGSLANVAGNSSWEFANAAAVAENPSWDFANAAAVAENSANWENMSNVNANIQPQGLGFQNSFYDYGGPSMIPTIPNAPPYLYPAVDGGSNLDNFGFTVQYVPPMGPTVADFNFGLNPTPSSVVPYEIGQGSSQPAAEPNALPPLPPPPPPLPQDPQNPIEGRFRHNYGRPY